METPVLAPHSCFHTSRIDVLTQNARQFIDITDEVQERVRRSGVRHGITIVTSMHTTASIAVNEHEPELHKDLDRLLRDIAPQERSYAHNTVPCDIGEHPNGHAHCQALLLSARASLAVAAGVIVLGRYQRIFLVELDHARPRTVTVSVLGV
jgi:secondary thiamine-phosphate synthase enzyme